MQHRRLFMGPSFYRAASAKLLAAVPATFLQSGVQKLGPSARVNRKVHKLSDSARPMVDAWTVVRRTSLSAWEIQNLAFQSEFQIIDRGGWERWALIDSGCRWFVSV